MCLKGETLNNLLEKIYNPDVLSCLANLSNDEVFTPPEVANKMIDLLPKELFESDETTFLDPCCKSGVFLREIMKRILNARFPNYEERIALINEKKMNKEKLTNEEMQYEKALQEKIDWVCHKQLYGISITRLTSLLSRRSLYCSKNANSKYSISKFDTDYGHIMYVDMKHTFKNGKCIYCGASELEFGEKVRNDKLESHAYQFIHDENIVEGFNMKFDVIIGNPPYQLSVGNKEGNKSKAKAIYHKFIMKSIELNPRYLVMITPSRWMTKTTEGIPDEWVDKMLHSNKFKEIYDFENEKRIFEGVDIPGGVNYFLWAKDYNGKCKYVFCDKNEHVRDRFDYLDSFEAGILVRNTNMYEIIDKIRNKNNNYYLNDDDNFLGMVSPKDFFTNKVLLTSSWNEYKVKESAKHNIKYYLNKNIHQVPYGFVCEEQIPKNTSSIKLNKVYISAAYGSLDVVLGKPFYGEPNSVCSQTYLVIGYDPIRHKLSKEQCLNIINYIKTKFFRFLVSVKKRTQNGARAVYQFVPLQDFTNNGDINWKKSINDIDKQLYKKYKLTKEEIEYIESMIKPMSDEEEDA